MSVLLDVASLRRIQSTIPFRFQRSSTIEIRSQAHLLSLWIVFYLRRLFRTLETSSYVARLGQTGLGPQR